MLHNINKIFWGDDMDNLGIELKAKSSKKIRIDFIKISEAIIKLTLEIHKAIFTPGTICIESITSGAFLLFQSVNIDDTPEGILSGLIQRSYKNAVEDLLTEYQQYIKIPTETMDIKILNNMLRRKLRELELEGFKVDNSFFVDFENVK
jgi:hypothetical protein